MTAKMSRAAADVVFGSPEVGIGELQGLVRRILTALTAEPNVGAGIAAAGSLIAVPFAPPAEPHLEWDAPAPVWEPADYTVPTAGIAADA